MNLSNRLTLSRIAMTFLLMWFLFMHGVAAKITAFVIFILACLTDLLDGWIARRRGEVSDFGKIMDPVADKILVLGVFVAFVELGLVPAWMVIVIVIRESMITSIRLFAIRKKGTVLAAENAGKHKTVSQMVTIFFILLFLIIKESVAGPMPGNKELQNSFGVLILFLMSITVALTLYSGFVYVWQNRKLIRSL